MCSSFQDSDLTAILSPQRSKGGSARSTLCFSNSMQGLAKRFSPGRKKLLPPALLTAKREMQSIWNIEKSGTFVFFRFNNHNVENALHIDFKRKHYGDAVCKHCYCSVQRRKQTKEICILVWMLSLVRIFWPCVFALKTWVRNENTQLQLTRWEVSLNTWERYFCVHSVLSPNFKVGNALMCNHIATNVNVEPSKHNF